MSVLLSEYMDEREGLPEMVGDEGTEDWGVE
jgi:hypothetical protein